MKIDIRKRMNEVKWLTEHTLSNEQFKQLILRKTRGIVVVAPKPKSVDKAEVCN